ncbi:unnamed protein product, partial [Musa acuminata subsp. burmannicoides]
MESYLVSFILMENSDCTRSLRLRPPGRQKAAVSTSHRRLAELAMWGTSETSSATRGDGSGGVGRGGGTVDKGPQTRLRTRRQGQRKWTKDAEVGRRAAAAQAESTARRGREMGKTSRVAAVHGRWRKWRRRWRGRRKEA